MFEVRKLNEDEIERVDELLDEHDKEFTKYKLDGDINIGAEKDGKLFS